jgi:hypothetical protein
VERKAAAVVADIGRAVGPERGTIGSTAEVRDALDATVADTSPARKQLGAMLSKLWSGLIDIQWGKSCILQGELFTLPKKGGPTAQAAENEFLGSLRSPNIWGKSCYFSLTLN